MAGDLPDDAVASATWNVGVVEGAREVEEDVARARVAVRLEDPDHAAVERLARG